jgi:thiamine-phosphate diphosphorylase
MKKNIIKSWRLYIITDESLSKGRTHQEIALAAIKAGASVIQLRDKNAAGGRLYQVATDIRKITRELNVSFIINDRIDIALAVDADGVHVGQEDLPAQETRELIGPERILGISAGNLKEAIEAQKQGADYLGVGPVFEARTTKADAGAPRGVDLIKQVSHHCRIPIIAIGGINLANIDKVIEAGATGAAVISAIVGTGDIELEIKKFLDRPQLRE